MHLGPRDLDKLTLHAAGVLAQKRLARGLRLNLPEATALLATQILELVRDGKSVAELMDLGRRMLGHRQVMPGVAVLLHDVQVEGTFPDGTKLVTVHDPIVRDDGDLALALYGSFLPVPDPAVFGALEAPPDPLVPGEAIAASGTVELSAGRPRKAILVSNSGDRPIQVGSHYPFEKTNSSLKFDRGEAAGFRLDIPAGTAVRFEPGDERPVTLVAFATSPPAFPASAPAPAKGRP